MIPWLTAFIATVVAVIAFLQWQTAREKVLLDLFDKRFAIYDELRAVVAKHLQTGISQTDTFDFARAAQRAKFLFGPEVQNFLDQRLKDLNAEVLERVRNPQSIEERRDALETIQLARLNRLSDFPRALDALVAPYNRRRWAG
jgi:hypothetical protein